MVMEIKQFQIIHFRMIHECAWSLLNVICHIRKYVLPEELQCLFNVELDYIQCASGNYQQ